MTINLHGKEYVEVKDRVAAAHTEDSYSMLREETFSMGGREYVRVYIDVKGKQYIGTAECKFNAAPKSPDGMSPFECGETSALGRALGFAGYGVVDSIASADEVVSNVQQERPRKPVQPLRNGDESPVTILRVMDVYERGIERGAWTEEDFYATISASLDKPINRENVRTLTQKELQQINALPPVTVAVY